MYFYLSLNVGKAKIYMILFNFYSYFITNNITHSIQMSKAHRSISQRKQKLASAWSARLQLTMRKTLEAALEVSHVVYEMMTTNFLHSNSERKVGI